MSDGSSVSENYSFDASILPCDDEHSCTPESARHLSSSSALTPPANAPPPFSAHNFSPEDSANRIKLSVAEPDSCPPPPFAPANPVDLQQPAASELEVATKAALASNREGESSAKSAEEKEPPPPYTEGTSPLGSFTYLMAAAGGPASIITQYDPASLQYMLDFFRTVAQTIPSSSPSPTTDAPSTDTNMQGSARDMLQDRAGIIVLREDLDFYAIPPKAEIDQSEMIDVKRAAGRALLKQDGIFSGLRKSEEAGTTEQHLIEMLTAGGFYNDDRWGHRASEPNKAVICSLALARLRTDIKSNDPGNTNAVGMAQKLLLFWRKPARRCWWEGIELDNVDGIDGKLKVWIRRVWTLEMVLPNEPANNFRKHVDAAFRTNVKIQNHAAIRAALTAGYETLDDLATSKLSILRQLADLSCSEEDLQGQPGKRRAPRERAKLKANIPKPRPFDTGRRSPHPNARRVLDGLPPPPPGRRRRVPTMINANHIPFLRFKKPQSPFLSHMIRKKTDEREKRITRIQRLENLLPWAEDEDRWDRILRQTAGLSGSDDGTSWATATREALFHVKQQQSKVILTKTRP
ncbi:MAG: hypothetical protein Q9166_000367 [cf. Caloplaca sp. 2 TL-2023]